MLGGSRKDIGIIRHGQGSGGGDSGVARLAQNHIPHSAELSPALNSFEALHPLTNYNYDPPNYVHALQNYAHDLQTLFPTSTPPLRHTYTYS
ncbi:uncharacterized protein FIBRA_09313 [Fibroporia radiculosa]|uniref:Uncharacterized protein n=1 Tax=Fibroporia radiculosa TaxID=599839 RepID=J7RVR2_9APHY|nr:uncharacterized protein FIBRA_09313 [Fibroporia radiculosa]CCM06995.1 predicted protein [Fibroporia radiculosa]